MKLIIRNIIMAGVIILIAMNAHALKSEQKRSEKVYEYIKRVKKEETAWKRQSKNIYIFNVNESLNVQKQDFRIYIKSKGTKRDANALPTVKDVFSIQVNREADAETDETYTIIYYLDNRPIEVFSDAKLPFGLKRTYRGSTNGIHTIGIQVVDKSGNVGIDTYRIEVRH